MMKGYNEGILPQSPSTLQLLSQLWRPGSSLDASAAAGGTVGLRQRARLLGCILDDEDCELILQKIKKRAGKSGSSSSLGPGGFSDRGFMRELLPWTRSWSIKDAAAQRSRLREQHDRSMMSSASKVEEKRKRLEDAKRALASWSSESNKSEDELRLVVEKNERSLDEEQDRARLLELYSNKQLERCTEETKLLREALEDLDNAGEQPLPFARSSNHRCFYCADLGREPHARRFCEILLERPNWRVFPREETQQVNGQNEPTYRPVGRAVVDFADDPTHGMTSMHVQGRQWFEQKHLLAQTFRKAAWMPKTYIIAKCAWQGDAPENGAEQSTCWFMKSAGSNYGRGVEVLSSPETCMEHAEKDETYVVQPHVARPMLLNGRKFHLKMYICPVARAIVRGRAEWELWVCRDGYLCEAKDPWCPDILTTESQVTIVRSSPASRWPGFWKVQPKCCAVLAAVLKRLVEQRKLRAQPCRSVFELFSADFVIDESWKAWLLEFNSGPVLRDHNDDVVKDNDSPETLDDTPMVREMMRVVIPEMDGSRSKHSTASAAQWEMVTKFLEPDSIN